jgi:hypothetical protein
MTCDCEKRRETDGNCGPGQKWDDEHQKCIPISEKETSTNKEQIGDPKTDSTQGTLPDGDP